MSDSPYRMSKYVVYSDASATWCGSQLDLIGEQVCNKLWDLEERRKSSTWRELCSLYVPFYPDWYRVGSYMKWCSDSQSARKIIHVRSMRGDLHVIALEISVPIMVQSNLSNTDTKGTEQSVRIREVSVL